MCLTALRPWRNLVAKGVAESIGPERSFYSWLNFVFNRVDEERIKEFGADRVAAEWILRCGGTVKFKNFEKWIQNYNAIPDGPKGKFSLEAISAKGISVTTGGLQHLVFCRLLVAVCLASSTVCWYPFVLLKGLENYGLQHLRHLNVNSCVYVTNIQKLLPVKGSLEELDIGNCVALSDISPLFEFKKLRKLVLINIPRIKQREETIATLRKRLPDCVIEQ
ncbi:ATP synthase subunit s, mitochondrial-like isoform X2 [Stylophora pistillata]|uniref:ATP synthase subunit s, mitochondrial-like isoform X2 n=1 Tax=Stylophora pistillata TaxID=50429 RepID=UPI000C0553F0|nr:ATP synthase subunit s, mitochondrial-like isoform X2 [Stylophora pistillata]